MQQVPLPEPFSSPSSPLSLPPSNVHARPSLSLMRECILARACSLREDMRGGNLLTRRLLARADRCTVAAPRGPGSRPYDGCRASARPYDGGGGGARPYDGGSAGDAAGCAGGARRAPRHGVCKPFLSFLRALCPPTPRAPHSRSPPPAISGLMGLTNMEQSMQSKLEQMMEWEQQQDRLREAELDQAQKEREEQQVPCL